MLGPGRSSLAIWTPFEAMATAHYRLLKWVCYISWKRAELSGSVYAVVGTSVVQGMDLVQGQSSIVSKPQLYQYYDETDRVVKLEYEREILEPLGGMTMAQSDVTLENTDGRFTPSKGLTCGTALFPNRPVSLFIGFEVLGQHKTVTVFKGLSDQPKDDRMSRIATIHSYDYLKFLNQYPLETTVYTNKRSDEIIKDILDTIGFSSDQYDLDVGLNTIAFAWFTKGTKAGDAIREICEAEEAMFSQDEEGIMHFENRRKYNYAPYTESQITITDDDIITWKEENSSNIINKVIVRAKPRAVVDQTEVWIDGVTEEILQGETKEIWARLENPCSSIVTPIMTTDYLANTAQDGSGSNVSANITVSIDKFTDTAKLTIQNNYAGTVYITKLRLRGTPALITSEIEESYEDTVSVLKYSTQILEIENNFIDSSTFAKYLAEAIVTKYKDPRRVISIEIRGIPHLQLRDRITVYDRELLANKDYRIIKIQGILTEGGFRQTLTLREITSSEADS